MPLADHITREQREIAERLSLLPRGSVGGAFAGRHRNTRHGSGSEFADHRAYAPGDDLRRIDWKAFARSDRLLLRRHEDETALRVHLVFDRSASMGWGPGGVTKHAHALRLAALLGCCVVRRRDSLILHACGPGGFSSAPGNTVRHLENALDRLAELRPEGETDLSDRLDRLAPSLGRRALIVLLSDLMTEPAPVLRSLAALRRAGHEILAYRTLAPEETDLALLPAGEFVDLETGERLDTDPATLAAAYREAFEAFASEWARGFAELRGDLVTANTAEDAARTLREHLTRRGKGGR